MVNSVWHMGISEDPGAEAVPGGNRPGMQAEFLAGLRVVSKWMVDKAKGWELGQAAGN